MCVFIHIERVCLHSLRIASIQTFVDTIMLVKTFGFNLVSTEISIVNSTVLRVGIINEQTDVQFIDRNGLEHYMYK